MIEPTLKLLRKMVTALAATWKRFGSFALLSAPYLVMFVVLHIYLEIDSPIDMGLMVACTTTIPLMHLMMDGPDGITAPAIAFMFLALNIEAHFAGVWRSISLLFSIWLAVLVPNARGQLNMAAWLYGRRAAANDQKICTIWFSFIVVAVVAIVVGIVAIVSRPG